MVKSFVERVKIGTALSRGSCTLIRFCSFCGIRTTSKDSGASRPEIIKLGRRMALKRFGYLRDYERGLYLITPVWSLICLTI